MRWLDLQKGIQTVSIKIHEMLHVVIFYYEIHAECYRHKVNAKRQFSFEPFFFFCLLAHASFALTYIVVQTRTLPPSMDFAYQRLVCSRNVARPETRSRLNLAIIPRHIASSSRVVSLIFISLVFSPLCILRTRGFV